MLFSFKYRSVNEDASWNKQSVIGRQSADYLAPIIGRPIIGQSITGGTRLVLTGWLCRRGVAAVWRRGVWHDNRPVSLPLMLLMMMLVVVGWFIHWYCCSAVLLWYAASTRGLPLHKHTFRLTYTDTRRHMITDTADRQTDQPINQSAIFKVA